MDILEEKVSTSCNICIRPARCLPVRLFLATLVILFVRIQHGYSQTEIDQFHWSVKTLVQFQQRLHPSLKVQDVYKLFYQAAFGVEHILTDSSEVASYVTREPAGVDSAIAGEPLLERISLENDVVRVNLRPFKHLNLSPALLVKAMFRSASETTPDTLMFYRMWNEFSSLVRFGLLEFPMGDLQVWGAKVRKGVIEPVHHSVDYVETNRPSYRVVRRDAFESVFGELNQ